MKFKVFVTSFVFAFVLIFSSVFVGCDDNKNYTYQQAQDVYNEMIAENALLFKQSGYVYIRYSNTNIANEINPFEDENAYTYSGAIKLTEKRFNFTKLARYSADPDTYVVNTEAVYEPTLNASMLILATYFKNSGVSGIDIPKEKLNSLYAKMVDLKSAISILNTQKLNLESKCRGDNFEQDARVQGALKNYCSAFLDAINKACITSDCFIDIYSNYIYTLRNVVGSNSLSPLAVNLEYLTKITDIASYYNNFYLFGINEKVKKGPQAAGSEIEVDEEFDWSIYTEYEQIKSLQTAAGEGADATTLQKEQDVIEAYNMIKSYDGVFYSNKEHALSSISTYRAIKNTSDMSLEETIATNKITEYSNDCKFVKNLFTELTNAILDFNGI